MPIIPFPEWAPDQPDFDPPGSAVIRNCTPITSKSYGPMPTPQLYSSNGSLTAPFQLLRGGHITWRDSISDSWWLRNHWGENPIDTLIGAIDRKLFSVRELTRACAPLRSPVDDFYFTNPIARASAVMAECSAIAEGAAALTAAE